MGSDLETRIRHVTAVLGPTNTGKTHLAIERMLGHESGMIGLPLRLLARDSDSVALLPTVVVQDELRSGRLVEYGVVPDLHENFYAISVQRQFEPLLLKALLKQSEAEVLGTRPV